MTRVFQVELVDEDGRVIDAYRLEGGVASAPTSAIERAKSVRLLDADGETVSAYELPKAWWL